MYRGKFLRRNNLHLLSSVCLCGLFHGGVIYCSTVSSSLISHSSDWDVIFFFSPSDVWAGGNKSVVPSHGCLGGNGTSRLPIAMSLFKNTNRGRALVKRLMITRLCRTFLLFSFSSWMPNLPIILLSVHFASWIYIQTFSERNIIIYAPQFSLIQSSYYNMLNLMYSSNSIHS